jgi:hypothetical protein
MKKSPKQHLVTTNGERAGIAGLTFEQLARQAYTPTAQLGKRLRVSSKLGTNGTLVLTSINAGHIQGVVNIRIPKSFRVVHAH